VSGSRLGDENGGHRGRHVMGGHRRRNGVLVTLGAVAFAGLASSVGGGWGIILVEGVAAALVVLLFLRGMSEEGDGENAG
jgi:hypothetical protein